jgi:hypothetical protein
MPVTETGYLCVADRVAELGLHVPNGFAILKSPRRSISLSLVAERGSDRMCRKLTCEDDIPAWPHLR